MVHYAISSYFLVGHVICSVCHLHRYFHLLLSTYVLLDVDFWSFHVLYIIDYSVKFQFYCVNTSYPMDNLLNRSAQTGRPNIRKRRPVFPPADRSVVLCTPQMAPRTSFLSRQPDVIASFSFGACTVQTCFQHLQIF